MYDANNERQKMCEMAETVNFLVPALIYNFKRLQTGCTGDDSIGHVPKFGIRLLTFSSIPNEASSR